MWQNRALLLGASVALASLGLLVRAQRAAGQKQEQLFIRVTERVDGKLTTSFGQSDLHFTFTATARNTGDPGTGPSGISTTTTDYACTVQGGGKITQVQDGTEVTTAVTYKSKDIPHVGISLAQIGQGTYEINADFGAHCGLDMDVQISGNNAVAQRMVGGIAAIELTPTVFLLGASNLAYDPFLKAGSPEGLQFYQRRSGTFDPNSKSFTRSGQASAPWTHKVPDGSATVSGSIDLNYTIGFNQEPEEVEAVITPVGDYDHWEPKAGDDEDTPGNGLAFNVVLQKKGESGKAPNKKAKSFKFELSDVSHEPGVCLNWPPKDRAKTSADLKIDKVANPDLHVADDGQSATSGAGLLGSSVIIFSYDWGAWGKLKVTATLEDDSTVVAHLKDKPDVEVVTIPKDDNGNHIAHAWTKDNVLTGSTQAESDDDDQPEGDGHTGDGLSLYEEYRGFTTGGAHRRTSPNVKDLFVYDLDNLGLGSFGASGLSVHFLGISEFTTVHGSDPNPLVVNFNHGFAHLCDVHVLLLVDGEAEGRLGMAEGGPGTPKKIQRVVVDVAKCMRCRWQELDVANNVAHELGHSCNVHHHGEDNYNPGGVWQRKNDGNWYPLGETGRDVAAPHMQNSGDQNCIMRYIYAGYYEYSQGQYRWHNPNKPNAWIYGESYPPAVQPGTIFCTSPEGTGENAPGHTPVPKAGDAKLGACARQICVNDLKH
jgi:hypothetical protein